MIEKKDSQIFKIRHSLSHILAMSILDKYKDAKITIGPVIDNGFYYDVDFGEDKITDADLKDFQKKMKKICSQKYDFVKEDISKEDALNKVKGNEYKEELINELSSDGKSITFYKTGDIFEDLCEGPHIENTSEINTSAFKLTKVAGAYWRGDENNKMLTRVYAVAFETKEELVIYENEIREAQKRDHRKLGKELELFTFSEKVGAGLPLFTPKGTMIRDLVVDRIGKLQEKLGWEKVTIPHITKSDLYKTSGHWDKFKDDLFHVKGKSDTEFVMKPMNCPHHTQIFAAFPKSYKDLPVRYSENTMVYRDEQAGELMGLSRVRSITQDDGHSFCMESQIEDEVKNIVSIIKSFYTDLGMFEEGKYWVSLSVMDPKTPEKYLNEDGIFEKAEEILEQIAKEENYLIKELKVRLLFMVQN